MTDGHTDIHLPPLDKRYSPIISSICGPNKFMIWKPEYISFLSQSVDRMKAKLKRKNKFLNLK